MLSSKAVPIVMLVGALAGVASAAPRTWKSADGKFTVKAELVEVRDDQVKLKKENGNVITVPLEKLSAADQKVLQSQAQPKPVENQAAMVKKLQEAGFGVVMREDRRLEIVIVANNPKPKDIGDEQMELVASATFLGGADLQGAKITDEGLKRLASAPNLLELRLGGSKITDDGMQYVAKLINLESLAVPSHVGDKGLRQLAGLTKLQELSLHGHITDQGVESLKDMRKLRRIDLSRAELGDASLAMLSGLTELRSITIRAPGVSDAGIKKLTGMPNLESLFIADSSNITDDAVPSLKQTKKLQHLSFIPARITAGGQNELKQAFPKASIFIKAPK